MEDNNILLEELRGLRGEVQEFRGEVIEWRQAIGERTAALETHIKRAIIGNGTPSELQQLKDRIALLERGHWKFAGILAACSAFFSIAIALAIEIAKHKLSSGQ